MENNIIKFMLIFEDNIEKSMKAFVIYLPDREHSVTHSNYMIEKLTEYGLDAKLFVGTPGNEAVERSKVQKRTLYPYSIKQQELSIDEIKELIIPEKQNEIFGGDYIFKFIKRSRISPDEKKLSLPGVQGCFYSHYALWRKCVELDEPIMIFEDDVKFFRGWKKIEWSDVLVLSLGKQSFRSEPYQTYLENPSGNPQPMPFRQFSMPGASGYAIKPPAAKTLIKHYKKYFYPADNAINQNLVSIQIHNYIMGRNTLPEEGNVSMTKYQGYDDENRNIL